MNGSLYTGASGLLSFQQGIDVESHNVANVNTVGFKSDNVSFNDLMYQSGVGKGVSMNDPFKNFSQGSLKPSNSGYDFAISGEGFFTLQDPLNPEKSYYTRTGQFSSNNENRLTNGLGFLVLGVQPVVTGDMITKEFSNNITSTIIDTDNSTYSLNTYTTDYKTNAKEIHEVMSNLTAIEAVIAGTATPEQEKILNDNPMLETNYLKYTDQITNLQTMSSGNNYKNTDMILNDIDGIIKNYVSALKNFSTNPIEGEVALKAQSKVNFPLIDTSIDSKYTVEVLINGVKVQQSFDTDKATTLKLFSDKINQFSGISSSVDTTTGEITIDSLISGNRLVVSNAKLNDQTLAVDNTQKASGSGQALIDSLYNDLEENIAKIGGSIAQNKSEIVDVANGNPPALSPIILDLNTLGMSSTLYEKIVNGDEDAIASYPGIESEDGNIYLRDGDARFLIGKLLPVTFTDLSGLNPQGDNIYAQGVDQSGPIYVAGSATVMGKFLENSNIDLSDTLVNLMVWQKAFDANSKTVMTSDELLKTALALKNS